MFKYSNNNKRYHTLDYYYKHLFNSKVFKISLNAGFSCPNLNTGGCIYCSKTGSGEYAGDKNKDLTNNNKYVIIVERYLLYRNKFTRRITINDNY